MLSVLKKIVPLIIAGTLGVYEAYASQKQEETIEELQNRVSELENFCENEVTCPQDE